MEMTFITNNWQILTISAIVLFFIIFYFVQNPKKIKESLIYWVTIAESDLGSGTGQLKLRKVYDSFITKYPFFSTFISFNTFSDWVDEALKFLNNQLTDNENVKKLVDEGNVK